jgi:hypothetical protein
MSTYQRYLRERKEVDLEESDLDEVNKLQAAVAKKPKITAVDGEKISGSLTKKSPEQFKLDALNALKTKAKTSSSDLTDDEVKRFVRLKQQAGEPVSKSIQARHDSLTGKSETPAAPTSATEPEQRPESPATTSADQTAAPTKPSGGSVQVSGNTITKILSSAGITDTSNVRNIITAFQEAAKDNNLKIKDGFLS